MTRSAYLASAVWEKEGSRPSPRSALVMRGAIAITMLLLGGRVAQNAVTARVAGVLLVVGAIALALWQWRDRLAHMDMDAFAAMTQRLIAEDGFDEFLPTACYPERRVLRVLEGVPDAVELESVALEWAMRERQGDEEVLVAFKIDDDCFKILRRSAEGDEAGIFAAEPQAERLLS